VIAYDAVGVVDGVSHRYGSRTALRDVSFAVSSGITGLVGANGAGKSTLLTILAGSLTPTAGAWRLDGSGTLSRRRRRTELRHRVALVPQSFVPPAWLRTDDFLHYMAWMRAVPRSTRAEAVDAALAATDLEARRDDRLTSLSGGMLRRALIAQALLGRPSLLLLDEPTAGLDPEQRIRIRELIRSRAADTAVVMSSHLMEDVVGLADRVVILDDGALAFDGTVSELADLGVETVTADGVLSPHEAAYLLLVRRGVER
jgi:ABC-2 type transport system ATP-binding protein